MKDWDESRQIALVESKPDHNEMARTLTVDLAQKMCDALSVKVLRIGYRRLFRTGLLSG